jgi:hypothetical protein
MRDEICAADFLSLAKNSFSQSRHNGCRGFDDGWFWGRFRPEVELPPAKTFSVLCKKNRNGRFSAKNRLTYFFLNFSLY